VDLEKGTTQTSSSKDPDTLSRAMAYQRSYDKFSTSGSLSCDIFNAVFLAESDRSRRPHHKLWTAGALACAEPCASATPTNSASEPEKIQAHKKIRRTQKNEVEP
jgi:hypothetical protein